MVTVLGKYKVCSYERVFFPTNEIESKADVIRYLRYDDSGLIASKYVDFVDTVVIDLRKDYGELFEQYDKKVRNEVKRGIKEGVICSLLLDETTTDIECILEDMYKKYCSFCDDKGVSELVHNWNKQEMLSLSKAGNIVVTEATFELGKTYHVYVHDKNTAMLWFSFVEKNDDIAERGNIFGWANRALHDYDIQLFIKNGLRFYDWGNITDASNPNGIDKFKMGFGGTVKTIYNCFYGNTLKGKLLIWIKKRLVKK